MDTSKESFLRHQFLPLLERVPSDTPPAWGKMTLQQMIEHFSDSVRIASGRSQHQKVLTPEEKLPKMQEFLMSNKPFRENTMNPLVPEVPAPVRNASEEDALAELQEELHHFFDVFEANEHLLTINPLFGPLNFQMNIQLLYKHARHHLRQFGVDLQDDRPQKATISHKQ
ncbi:hypothetical protein V9K67_24910 [Paraflavisolibacter sp. H34]|uniref:hypothetical protein n=1 Tax=Huijunlia imazamoxiresistens TaxID=3127457 RepID=UPI003015DEA5